MIRIIRTCDICGKDYVKLNVKYKVKGTMKRFGLQSWEYVDLCDNCIDVIRKAVNEKDNEKTLL